MSGTIIKRAAKEKGKRLCGYFCVFLKTAGFQDETYEIPEESGRLTFREIIAQYLCDVGTDPLSDQDQVYLIDTSDFPHGPTKQLLEPSQLDEPVRLYDGIEIQRQGG